MILVNKKLFAHVFMNKYTSDPNELCKKNDDLSNPFEGFNEGTPKSNHFMFQLPANEKQEQVTAYLNENLPGTGVVRLGDIDLDGFQDISITFSESDKEPKTFYFKNSECTEEIKKQMNPNPSAGQHISFDKCRYFKKSTDLGLIENVNAYSSSFFDYHEMG